MTASSHILRLREYQSASIGDAWNVSTRTVPPSVVAELERLQAEQRTQYLRIARRHVKAQNYVGVIGVSDRSIEILPKTDEADDSARRRLVEMISLAGLLPHLESGVADLAASVPCLLDAFMQAYCRQLALEWRRGRISDYRRTDDNRTHLRGKLLFHEQLRRNQFRPERFYTRADQFVADVAPSRLLKAGLDVCRRHGSSEATRRAAHTLLAEFDEISHCRFTEAELDAIQADRKTERFAPLLTLAKRLVRGCVSDRPGGAATYSLLFDMNVVFEQYIARLLRTACPPQFQVQLQVAGRSLVLREGRRKFRLRPDIAVRHGRRFSLLVDTKWKLLDAAEPHHGVKQSDMYQAYAYAREFHCPRVVLLYPRHGPLPPLVATYRLQPADESSPRIEIRTVDVTRPAGQVRRELAEMAAAGLPPNVAVGECGHRCNAERRRKARDRGRLWD